MVYCTYIYICLLEVSSIGYPLHRENRENGQKMSGKTQKIWKFCQNTGKTQGIWFAQVVNSLVLKVKDIFKFAANLCSSLPNQFCVCNCHKSHKLAQGIFVIGRGKTGKHREFENAI